MNRISHIEIRFRDGKYYVLIVKEVGEKQSKVGFVSANETQARNVARNFAKQHSCMIHYSGDDKIVDDDFDPEDDSPAEA